MQSSPKSKGVSFKFKKQTAIIIVIVLLIAFLALKKDDKEVANLGPAEPVKRGDLPITIVEGGTISTLELQEIRSEVHGSTKIMKLVDEGYFVTEDDVANGMVLVQLDSAELEKEKAQQEIALQSAMASLTEAEASYEIQLKQNDSDIQGAELKLKFAKMDFYKYLGESVADELLQVAIKAEGTGTFPAIDFSKYVDDSRLGGEANQRRRKLATAIKTAQEELAQAKERYGWTEKLEAKGYVSSTEKEQDSLTQERRKIAYEEAQTAEDLFARYEFPKDAEKLLSDFVETYRQLGRTKTKAFSQLARVTAGLKRDEFRATHEQERLNEINEQLQKCTIKAERVGMVIYDSDPYRGRIMEVGASVHERQTILRVPDLTQLSADIAVHESVINKVEEGQPVVIKVDAFPDRSLNGVVHKVGVLPNEQNRWYNPDKKVYDVTVAIDGIHEWLKPGMSADAEIKIAELKDVLYVPMQAVFEEEGQNVCYVKRGSGVERIPVEPGDFNDTYIEIASGLADDDQVYMQAPPHDEADPLDYLKDLDEKDAPDESPQDMANRAETDESAA